MNLKLQQIDTENMLRIGHFVKATECQVPIRTHKFFDLIGPICRENLLTSDFFSKEVRKIKSSKRFSFIFWAM